MLSRSVALVFFLAIFFIFQTATTTEALPKIEIFKTKNGTPLRILTFNTWIFGGEVNDGLYKLAKHIKLLQPDIVALQEVQTHDGFQQLLDKLGPEWSGVASPSQAVNVGIISIHKIDNSTLVSIPSNTAIGVNIQLRNSSQIISFWCLHLAYLSYGPYAANNKMVSQMNQILEGEYPVAHDGRGNNAEELLKTPGFKSALILSKKNPMIVCGDFNSPSHLDWIDQTKSKHGGWIIQWPATYLLQKSTGLLDSYRTLHPDPLKNPGITWSTVHRASGAEWDYKIPEPLDRIDFILYKSPKLNPTQSFTYSGQESLKQIPDHADNDYPSDHFSVITDFVLKDSSKYYN